jgi:hypothetical protein
MREEIVIADADPHQQGTSVRVSFGLENDLSIRYGTETVEKYGIVLVCAYKDGEFAQVLSLEKAQEVRNALDDVIKQWQDLIK